MEPYKIILVDDHSLFRNGLRGLLERCAASFAPREGCAEIAA